MKSLKKTFILLLSLAIIATSAFMLFSCDEDPCTEHKDDNTDGLCDVCGATVEVPKDPDTIELIKDGKATFKIVIGTGNDTDTRMKVNEQIVAVFDKLNIDVEVVDDNADTATDCEIIINGATTRGDAYKVDPHYLGAKGYAVKLVGTKVLVLAGSANTLDDAIEYLVEEIFGISGKTKKLDNVSMTVEQNLEEIQTGYAVTSVTLSGNNFKDYVIATDLASADMANLAKSIQSLIYTNTGLWLPVVNENTNPQKAFFIRYVEEACDEGFSVVEKDGNLVMECEFQNKFAEAALGFVRSAITTKKGEAKIEKSLPFTKEVRRIYYKDFGAKGDGKTDDFIAIREAHKYANQYGHTVCSDIGNPTYYIGDVSIKQTAEAGQEIVIKTNVEWYGAKFIFDDSKIPVEYKYAKHQYKNPVTDKIEDVVYTDLVNNAPIPSGSTCSRCLKDIYEDKGGCTNNGAGWHTLSIFSVESDYQQVDLTKKFAGARIKKGDTKITLADGTVYAPGQTMLIQLQDNTSRHYIRYGGNANNGSNQTEIILVLADGTIDESTPLHWDYNTIYYAVGTCADDKPITIDGGEKGCIVTTIANQGPNYYYSYGRNIETTRSNTTIKGIKHYITGEGLPGKGKCPTAFTRTTFANAVTYEDMLFTHQLNHYDAGNKTLLGTYEIAAGYCNKLTWKRCDQTNFFNADGSVTYKGFFGTNYCKNFVIEDSVMESFDAHCGTYNVTLKNSTFEHINCVGEGLIYMEDLTVYTDGNSCLVSLRTDYGCPWNGEVFAKNITLKSSNTKDLSIFNGGWTNHYFGYTCYLPHTITLDNLKIVSYDYSVDAGGVRHENEVGINTRPLHVYAKLEQYTDVDISDPNANMGRHTNDWVKCLCGSGDPNAPEIYSGKQEFNDTDGDGRCNNTIISKVNVGNKTWCWGFEEEPDTTKNVNPYIPPENIYILNCKDLQLIVPPTPQFASVNIFIDGAEAIISGSGLAVKKED